MNIFEAIDALNEAEVERLLREDPTVLNSIEEDTDETVEEYIASALKGANALLNKRERENSPKLGKSREDVAKLTRIQAQITNAGNAPESPTTHSPSDSPPEARGTDNSALDRVIKLQREISEIECQYAQARVDNNYHFFKEQKGFIGSVLATLGGGTTTPGTTPK